MAASPTSMRCHRTSAPSSVTLIIRAESLCLLATTGIQKESGVSPGATPSCRKRKKGREPSQQAEPMAVAAAGATEPYIHFNAVCRRHDGLENERIACIDAFKAGGEGGSVEAKGRGCCHVRRSNASRPHLMTAAKCLRVPLPQSSTLTEVAMGPVKGTDSL